MFLIAATPKFAAQAIRKTYDIGWTPVRYSNNVSASINVTVLKPAGLGESKGAGHRDLCEGRDRRPLERGRGFQTVRGVHRQIHVAELT